MTCDEVVDACIESICAIRCKPADGRIAVVFPFLYPDHDNVELFVREFDDHQMVSELGHALRYLDNIGFDFYAGWKAAFQTERIAARYEVSNRNVAFCKRCTAESVGEAMLDVASVCLAVAGLSHFDDRELIERERL